MVKEVVNVVGVIMTVEEGKGGLEVEERVSVGVVVVPGLGVGEVIVLEEEVVEVKFEAGLLVDIVVVKVGV